MFHKKAWNTPKTSHHIPPFLRSLSQFIQRSLAIETQPGTFQPKQTFFPQRSLSQSYQKRFAQNIPTTFLPYVPAWNIPAKTNFPPQRSLSQFTQRSLAIETHLLTARFPQRSLSQSYQKRFAQNNPAKTNFLPLSEAFLCTCTAASLYTNSGIHTKSHIEAHVPLLTAASPHRQQDNQHFVTKNRDKMQSYKNGNIVFL